MTCDCKTCQLLRRLKPLLAKAEPDEREAFEELFTRYEHSSMDADYWQMKYKGTWPGDEAVK